MIFSTHTSNCSSAERTEENISEKSIAGVKRGASSSLSASKKLRDPFRPWQLKVTKSLSAELHCSPGTISNHRVSGKGAQYLKIYSSVRYVSCQLSIYEARAALSEWWDVLLTPQQAAEFLAFAPKTLNNWRSAGKGPRFEKVGGLVRYRLACLLDFLEPLERKSTSQKGGCDA